MVSFFKSLKENIKFVIAFSITLAICVIIEYDLTFVPCFFGVDADATNRLLLGLGYGVLASFVFYMFMYFFDTEKRKLMTESIQDNFFQISSLLNQVPNRLMPYCLKHLDMVNDPWTEDDMVQLFKEIDWESDKTNREVNKSQELDNIRKQIEPQIQSALRKSKFLTNSQLTFLYRLNKSSFMRAPLVGEMNMEKGERVYPESERIAKSLYSLMSEIKALQN